MQLSPKTRDQLQDDDKRDVIPREPARNLGILVEWAKQRSLQDVKSVLIRVAHFGGQPGGFAHNQRARRSHWSARLADRGRTSRAQTSGLCLVVRRMPRRNDLRLDRFSRASFLLPRPGRLRSAQKWFARRADLCAVLPATAMATQLGANRPKRAREHLSCSLGKFKKLPPVCSVSGTSGASRSCCCFFFFGRRNQSATNKQAALSSIDFQGQPKPIVHTNSVLEQQVEQVASHLN